MGSYHSWGKSPHATGTMKMRLQRKRNQSIRAHSFLAPKPPPSGSPGKESCPYPWPALPAGPVVLLLQCLPCSQSARKLFGRGTKLEPLPFSHSSPHPMSCVPADEEENQAEGQNMSFHRCVARQGATVCIPRPSLAVAGHPRCWHTPRSGA